MSRQKKEEELRIAKVNMSKQRFLCRNTTQQTTGIRKEKSAATKEFPVVIEFAKDSKKSCHDKVEWLKRKMFVATRKMISRRIPEVKETRSWLQIGLVLRHRISGCVKNKTATPNFGRDIIKVYRDKIQERVQKSGRDKRMHATTEANDKDLKLCRNITFYVAIE